MTALVRPEVLAAVEAAVLARDGRREGREIRFRCPKPDHADAHPSARWNPDKGVWHCFVCHKDGEGGGALDLAQRLGLEVPSRAERRRNDKARRNGHERHELRDPGDAHEIAVHCRKPDGKGDKIVWWEQPDGTKGLNGVKVADLPLYGAHLLADLPDGADVVVTEGEKACDALLQRGIVAVATVCGAGVTPSDASLQVLSRFTVKLWPDNDAAGREHMQRIAARLHSLGVSCQIIRWENAPDKGAAADFDGDDDAVQALIDAARLYEREPIPDGEELLDDIVQIVVSYVVLTREQADATALWLLHTYAIDAADATPYLHVTSPEKRSGKTRLLEVLDLLAARPWFTGRVTAAVLQRRLERDHPSLLLDETDAAFKKESEYSEALRAILNAGHRRGCKAWLCVKKGGDIDLVGFDVFGPKALAGIGKLPETVADRCIRIVLRRRAPSEPVTRFRRREVEEEARPIRERLERWAAANVEALRTLRPHIPDYIDDRAIDGWEPLFAIADIAGGEWPQRSRMVALALSHVDVRDDDSVGVKLLADIQAVFGERGVDRLPTAELLTVLNALDESPWGDYKGKPLTPRGLAKLLRPHAKPILIRIGEDVARGYNRDDFADAWQRYLPSIPAGSVTSVTGVTEPAARLNLEPESVTDVTDVTANTGIGENTRQHPSPLVQTALDWGATLVEPDADDLPFDDLDAVDDAEARCHVCGSTEFYFGSDGTGPVCARCHPNPQALAGAVEDGR